MLNTRLTREMVGLAHDRTHDLITELRKTLASLTATGLEKTPAAQHLFRALEELQKAKMQAGAYLDIS